MNNFTFTPNDFLAAINALKDLLENTSIDLDTRVRAAELLSKLYIEARKSGEQE